MSLNPSPVLLSQANVTQAEADRVAAAVLGGWVAPAGPELAGFEADMQALTGRAHAVALSSGTAALHLGLKALGVGPGDPVVIPTMTFAATAFAATYLGATPVLVDVEGGSWNLDPDLLAAYLAEAAALGELPAAIVPVDLFGRTADYDRILLLAAKYGVPVLVDAAESVGSSYRGQPAGSQGRAAIFSFNGNKIMTTSGGGMLLSDDGALCEKVRFWSTQSREPAPWYEHHEIGYNYRLSNVLAALGRAQYARLGEMIARRREINQRYRDGLGDARGVVVTSDPSWGQSNAWLTTITLDRQLFGADIRDRVLDALARDNIEARPLWKPLHLQPVLAGCPTLLNGTAEGLFECGLCLPSGAGLTDAQVDRVIDAVRLAVGI